MCGLLLCISVSLNAKHIHPHSASLPIKFSYFKSLVSLRRQTLCCVLRKKKKKFVDLMGPINIISLKPLLSLQHTQINTYPSTSDTTYILSSTTHPSIFQCVTQLKLFGHDEMNPLSSALLLGQRCVS